MSASQIRDELMKAERLLNTEFSFDLAESIYRRCLNVIKSTPQDQQEIEQLLVDLFRTKQVSSEPLAYLMHLLRWEGVRLAIEMDLRTLDSPIATGADHAKVLAAFEPEWENREFYRFA